MTIFSGCKCCGKKGPCWKCYGKINPPINPPDDCGSLGSCECENDSGETVRYTAPDSVTAYLTYDNMVPIENDGDLYLEESEVDRDQINELVQAGKDGIEIFRTTLQPDIPNAKSEWYFKEFPLVDRLDGGGCAGGGGGYTQIILPLDGFFCSGLYNPTFSAGSIVGTGTGMGGPYESPFPVWEWDGIGPLPPPGKYSSTGYGTVFWNVVNNKEPLDRTIEICEGIDGFVEISWESTGLASVLDCVKSNEWFFEERVCTRNYDLLNAKITIRIQMESEDIAAGVCCLPTGECVSTTHQDCADQCGVFTFGAMCEDVECESEVEEYQCFDAPPDEDGWTPVGDCHPDEKSCAEACGPCWRCYRKLEIEACESQEITATLEVISVSGFNGAEIDTSEETGLPVGTKFKLESAQPVSASLCEFYFSYISPITGSCAPFIDATIVSVVAFLSGNQLASNQVYGRGNDAVFTGDKQLSCGSIPNNRGGSFPWDDSLWDGFGRHRFTVPIVDLNTESVQIGEIVYEINVIDLSGDDPDIPKDFYDYQCFDAPPSEAGWEPVGDCHSDEESCAAACGAESLCCIPPATLNGLYQCLNTTKEECDSLGGGYVEGYKSEFCEEGSTTVDPLCGAGIPCQDQPLCFEGDSESCIEYTVTIDSIQEELTECALSFALGTDFGNGYPLSEGLNPPCGQKIPGFTPTFRWVENSVTVRDGEIGYLIAEIDIDGLKSLNSHQNALFPDDPTPPTPGSPSYSGGMSCKVVQKFPFFVKGCEISGAAITIGSPFPPRCELPSNVYQLEGVRGGDLSVLESNQFISGLSELDTQGQVVLPECGCNESCSSDPIEVKYTFRSNEFGFETVKWWPSDSPRPQSNSYLGTSWIVESNQKWTLSLSQKTIDCDNNRKEFNPLP